MAPMLAEQPVAEREVRREQIGECQMALIERAGRRGGEDRDRRDGAPFTEGDGVDHRRVRTQALWSHALAEERRAAPLLIRDHLGGEAEAADELAKSTNVPGQPVLRVLDEDRQVFVAKAVRREDQIGARGARRLEGNPDRSPTQRVRQALGEPLPSRDVEGRLVDLLDQG